MDDVIKALTILRKYGNPRSPFQCSHDILWVDIKPELVPDEDKAALAELGFSPDGDGYGFTSFRFGSC